MPLETPWKPTREQLAAGYGKSVPDVIARDLEILFCGINPGLYSGAVRRHFARPGNRFWPALFDSGFSDRLLSPFESELLLERGWGITNLVERATATADQLEPEELVAGVAVLAKKVRKYKPAWVAVLGVTAYRTAFQRPKAKMGRQDEKLEGAGLWVLPNPSGLNAHFQKDDLAVLFTELRSMVEERSTRARRNTL